MAIRDVEVKIQLSELENVVMVAHFEAMKAAGLSPEGNMKAANIRYVRSLHQYFKYAPGM